MSNFRIKVLGLTALATVFAGMSYGQVIACTGTATFFGGAAFSNPTLRAEGQTELTADAQATGCTTTVTTTGAVFVTVSLPITSKGITAAGYTGNSEATLQYTQGGATTIYPGTVTGTQASFPGVTFTAGAAFVLQVSNIRVNASTANNPQVTETMDVQYTSAGLSANYSPSGALPYNIGYILASLGATSFTGVFPFQFNSYTVCAGNPLPFAGAPTGANLSFTVQIKELVGGAFKTQAQEVGSYVAGGASNVGTASSADQLVLTLGNIPSAATVYVPQAVTVNGTTITLANTTAVTAPASIVALGVNEVAFTPSNGVVTITYTTTAAVSTGASTFLVPTYIIFAANSAAAQGPMTALVSYAPAAVVTGPAAAVPTFAVSTATALSASVISVCQTTLLFPYVTNATGFETGIAIANTTTDNLSAFPPGGSIATPTAGTCTLWFYGNAASPTATVTPTMGAYTAAAPTVVPVYANILTTLVGSSGFSGYAIARCNFLDAHGFAFILDTSGTSTGPEGYLAVVIPNGRGEGPPL